MDNQYSVRSLFKGLLVMYALTLIIIVHKLHDDTFNQTLSENERKLLQLRNRSQLVRNVTKIVYINHTEIQYIKAEKAYYGPGENGANVEFPTQDFDAEELQKLKAKRKAHGFNTYLSDTISLHRKIPDMRPQKCKDIVYPEHLPPASVVIIFRDEWPSILLRTAYSVLETSPDELIKEVILVDDGSLDTNLKRTVDIHVAAVPKFKLVHNKVSMGLMMARQKGIEAVSADYFVVMDGHMEVGKGWLEPLIYRLIQQPNALLCSHVGSILQDDLATRIDDPNSTNQMFDTLFPFFDHLTLDQMWARYSDEFRTHRNHSVAPIEYGTIQGMMAVMRKDFFLQLGGFDPGMQIWGSEQMELSIKVWLCGGRIEMVPCSKVVHMYRVTPWGGVKTGSDYHSINKARTFEVWMDGPYQDQLRDFIKDKEFVVGDLEPRHRIRIDNKCKPYQYYVDKVKTFSDVYIPENLKARGHLKNKFLEKCIDLAKINETYSLLLYGCHEKVPGNQYFILTQDSQIRSTQGALLNAITQENNITVLDLKMSPSKWHSPESIWQYTSGNTLLNVASNTCLTAGIDDKFSLNKCNGLDDQVWEWNRL